MARTTSLTWTKSRVCSPSPKIVGACPTFIRSIADFNRDFHLEDYVPEDEGEPLTQSGKRSTSAVARSKIFEILVQVAKTLILAREVQEILGRVVDLLFEHLPVDRAIVVLVGDEGRLVPMLSRQRGKAWLSGRGRTGSDWRPPTRSVGPGSSSSISR